MAKQAKGAGVESFCMGVAWRKVLDGPEFDAVLQMVRRVSELGMEACVTVGISKPHRAQALADVGLTAYNHNIRYWPLIISRRY